MNVQLQLPDTAIEAIARMAAEIVLAELRQQAPGHELLNADEAATTMRCTKQRVYDLVSAGRLPRVKDGARLLIRRADIDRYLGGG
jgi:excisionase family DNA binding protein